jgi:hypothetical protein
MISKENGGARSYLQGKTAQCAEPAQPREQPAPSHRGTPVCGSSSSSGPIQAGLFHVVNLPSTTFGYHSGVKVLQSFPNQIRKFFDEIAQNVSKQTFGMTSVSNHEDNFKLFKH